MEYNYESDINQDQNSNNMETSADTYINSELADESGTDLNKENIEYTDSGNPIMMRYTPPPPDFYIPPPIPQYEVINDNTIKAPPYSIDESGDVPAITIPQREPDYDDGKDPIGDARMAENLNEIDLENMNMPEQLPPDDFEDLNAFDDAPDFDAVGDIDFAPDFDAVGDIDFAPDIGFDF